MNCMWLILILLLCGNNKKGDCSVTACPCCDNDRPVVKPCGCDCNDRPVVKPCGCDCNDRPEPRTTYPNYGKMNSNNTCGCEEN